MNLFSMLVSFILTETNILFFNIIIRCLLIVVTTLLSKWKLKYSYYKHHYFSIIMIFIGTIIYIITDIVLRLSSFTFILQYVFLFICLMFIAQIFTGIQEVSEKYLMEKEYLNPFFLLFCEGLVEFICTSLMLIPLAFMVCPFGNILCSPMISPNIENLISTATLIFQTQYFFLFFILLIISYFIFNFTRVQTNKHFSPSHRSVADIFGSFLSWIASLIFSSYEYISFAASLETINIIIFSIVYLFMILGVLIYLEIFIINCCGLEQGTSENIKRRVRDEEDYLQSSINASLYPNSGRDEISLHSIRPSFDPSLCIRNDSET